VTQVVTSDDPARDVAEAPLETTGLVDEPLELPSGSPGTVTILSERPGQFRLQADSPTRQLLVVLESYHPGWQAEVDGRPQPVVRVNGDFMGCLVGPGQQEVVLDFRPRSLLLGRALSLLGMLAMCGCVVADFLLRPRKSARRGNA